MNNSGHNFIARAIGIAEWIPYILAAYEQEETTPRSSGRPPTAKGLSRREGLLFSSTEQKNASKSICRIFLGIYSYFKAVTGTIVAARNAGYRPESIPIRVANIRAKIGSHNGVNTAVLGGGPPCC